MVLLTRTDAINRRITSKNKILVTILTGVIFLILAILILMTDPIGMIVKYKLRLGKDTILTELLQHELQASRLSLYLFNITNAERFLAGEDPKLKVEEVGPFVFQEYRWYEDMQMSEDGKEMAMTPKIRSEFIPEASIADPKDVNLTLLNLPFLSATALLSNYPSFVRYTYNIMAAQLRSKAIINIDVHNYLWGYENPVITICNKLVPGLVYFDKIGLLDRLYDNESDYRVVVGATVQDRFKIKSVKKFRHIQMGSIKDVDESEQTFPNTYEGIGYPQNLTPDMPIDIYRVSICKTFNLKYAGSRHMYYGGEGFVYNLSNDTFMKNVNPITLKEYPDGLMGISKCYYGLPFVVSKGHFLDCDPKLLDHVDGLKPDKNVHVNELIIDRKVSVTVDTKISLQLSLVIDDLSYNRETKKLSNSVVPIVHVKAIQPKLPEGIMSKFTIVYKIGPYVEMSTVIVLSVIGLAFLAHAVRSMYYNWAASSNKGMVFESALNKHLMNSELPLIRQCSSRSNFPEPCRQNSS